MFFFVCRRPTQAHPCSQYLTSFPFFFLPMLTKNIMPGGKNIGGVKTKAFFGISKLWEGFYPTDCDCIFFVEACNATNGRDLIKRNGYIFRCVCTGRYNASFKFSFLFLSFFPLRMTWVAYQLNKRRTGVFIISFVGSVEVPASITIIHVTYFFCFFPPLRVTVAGNLFQRLCVAIGVHGSIQPTSPSFLCACIRPCTVRCVHTSTLSFFMNKVTEHGRLRISLHSVG